MPIKERKVHKVRGQRTHGKGKKGSRVRDGGKGMAGSHKHKWSWIIKYKPDHFGGDSMKSLKKKPKATNIGYLNEYALTKGITEIDAIKLGFSKVLGGGNVTKPLKVRAKFFTQKAKEKLEKAGGEAITK